MQDSLLKIDNAAFAYDTGLIFRDIDWQVRKGEIWCLMGHNGCGKSTLLDCILGVHKLADGQIYLSGKPLNQYNPQSLAKNLSYIPQGHDRSFPYKVRQIVLMGRTAYLGGLGSPNAADKALVKQVMTEVGIEHLADRPYTQISGGEMQMVLLARALVQETPLIIMDEPTAHLDYYNELLFLETVSRLLKDGKKTVIMATHSPNQALYLEARGLSVKVAMMNNGRLAVSGKPSQILTVDNLRRHYRIETRILQDGNSGGLQQIVPLYTLKES
ncbi:MAG: ABC transporter ATP-binding protein [Bacillota bacterium]|jgi:iron complex transport system ATP-binding protein